MDISRIYFQKKQGLTPTQDEKSKYLLGTLSYQRPLIFF